VDQEQNKAKQTFKGSFSRTNVGGCPGPMTVPHLFLALPPRSLQLSIARSTERGSQNKIPTAVRVAAPPALSGLSYPQKTRNHY
jgi:hypothetical protein